MTHCYKTSLTYVDLMVIHLSCSSFLVSVALVSPALEAAMMPALATRESVRVDLPWSTWAITDMFLMFLFLSIHCLTWSTVKFTYKDIKIRPLKKEGNKPEKKNNFQWQLQPGSTFLLLLPTGQILYENNCLQKSPQY